MPLIPFARKSQAGPAAKGYGGSRLLNYFYLPAEDSVSPGILLGRSGLVAQASVPGAVRAVVESEGALYAVAGGKVLKVVGSVSTSVGTVPDDAATQMAASGGQIAIVAQGKYYVCDGASTAQYGTGAVTNPVGVATQDGYFVVVGSSAGRNDALTVSAIDDATVFDTLDFAFAETHGDKLVGVISDHGELWLFGSRTVELFYNSGAADFPFQRNTGAIIERGCHSGATVAKLDNSVFWVGDDLVVYRAAGSSPTVISSREIEDQLRKSIITSAFTFSDRGHKFYAINREGETTLCFDVTTGLWSERSTGVADGPWQARAAATVNGVQMFGTSASAIATLDEDAFTDAGQPFVSEAISLPIEGGGAFVRISKVHMNFNTGDHDLGLIAADGVLLGEDGEAILTEGDEELFGTDMVPRLPYVMLQTSRDGRTWSLERWRSLGGLGEYFKRVVWHGLGAGRRMQFRIRITDEVKRDLYGVSYE